ncbi:Hypothetical protein NGAL_HAMBI1146_31830 [Neorhizobium galegae bv. officinalis]|nr:Hypothetical protein NGAL_HAMBI1146_31830 [Neorhizobium galegae bv. officinalis]
MTEILNYHIQYALGARGAKKAKKRRSGGDANDNGHAFEQAFTINAILLEMCSSLLDRHTGHQVRFKSQPLGFVDDLVIIRNSNVSDYFELKSGSSQRCTTTLKYNIARQQQVLIKNRLDGRINLILHKTLADDVEIQKRATGVPIYIIGFEENRFLDYELVMAALPDLVDAYRLLTLRILLNGAWYNLDRNATIDEINAEWRYLAINPIRSTNPIGVSQRLRSYFRAVGIVLKEERDVVRYQIGGLGGLFHFQVGSDKWKDFEQFLLNAWPTDSMAVHEIIEEFNHG